VSQFVKAHYIGGFFIANLPLAIYSEVMSELLNFYSQNDQPHVDFIYDDEYYDLNWNNTTVYLHCPPYEQIDHIFWTEVDPATLAISGLFMFRQTIGNFTQVAKQLIDHKYRWSKAPLPAEGDLDAWIRLNSRDLDE